AEQNEGLAYTTRVNCAETTITLCAGNYNAHNVYYVKCTRTFKRHVKAAGFVHVKKLLAHKFDPFPAVTLSEFC
ncbi:hypothetical protein ACV2GT_08215, partial [Salmonella enterica subsp. enterica serovar Madelia]